MASLDRNFVKFSSNPPGRVRVLASMRSFTKQELKLRKSSSSSLILVRKPEGKVSEIITLSFGNQPGKETVRIYAREIKPVISRVFGGRNATVVAFGAIGSGKTHTIQGSEEKPGLAILAMDEIISTAQLFGKFVVVSLYEIYQEHSYGVLNPEWLSIMANSTSTVSAAVEVETHNEENFCANANKETTYLLEALHFLRGLFVQLQKCDKCSRKFFSSINCRRHVRIHHRLKKLDKDTGKSRELLENFWNKLSAQEERETVSFKDLTFEYDLHSSSSVSCDLRRFNLTVCGKGTGIEMRIFIIQGVCGSTIINNLAALILRAGFAPLPQTCGRAGGALLDIIQARPSTFPITAEDLFSILDDASEMTFLSGLAFSMQKYIFEGEAAKIKAWIDHRDIEALRFQKSLVEEEEAAQRKQAERLEKKRQKKLKQKARDSRVDPEKDHQPKLDSPKNGLSAEASDNVAVLASEDGPSKKHEVLIGSTAVKIESCNDLQVHELEGHDGDRPLAEYSLLNRNINDKICTDENIQPLSNSDPQPSYEKSDVCQNLAPESLLPASATVNDVSLLASESKTSENLLFSIYIARDFLARRWKEANSGDHVKLLLLQESNPEFGRDSE
ncbi:hypothetical protein SAY87_027162 [Trapa incisa]|uniref:C2H2-type domain-containing protein n=1 Tax=Trapa incisa TaxID=236973 RepID=A0AAN7GSX6_9MYRT|nr:hypothetical protein SAY87_027162 [Trapa incisa]